jgi:hypothetical protein
MKNFRNQRTQYVIKKTRKIRGMNILTILCRDKSVTKIVSLQRQGRPITRAVEFQESTNILSPTSVYINEEFSKPTFSMCNQEDKENAGYENFDNANVAASLLMLFRCSSKESRLQEPCECPHILSSTSVYIKIIIIID